MSSSFPRYAGINGAALRAFAIMAFKLTYSDGQESQHDDDTVWEIDDGVLKLGREKGKWSVFLSPSHWAVLELGGASKDEKSEDDDSEKDDDSEDHSDKDKDEDNDKKDEKDGD